MLKDLQSDVEESTALKEEEAHSGTITYVL